MTVIGVMTDLPCYSCIVGPACFWSFLNAELVNSQKLEQTVNYHSIVWICSLIIPPYVLLVF